MSVSLPLRASFLLPYPIGSLTQALFVGAVPVFVRASFGSAFLFPKLVGALADDPVEVSLCFHQNIVAIAIRRHGATSADMHPGRKTFELIGRNKLRMSRSRQRFLFKLRIRLFSSRRPRARPEMYAGPSSYRSAHRLIPRPVDRNRYAQSREPIEMIVHG